MNLKFLKPTIVSRENGEIVLEPLQPGFGHTIGNVLRRILLSSMPGSSAIALSIPNIYHELSDIPGAITDALDLKMNLKKIRFEAEGDGLHTLKFSSNRVGMHTAKDFTPNEKIKILNPDQPLINLTGEETVSFTVYIKNGIGYVDENEHHDFIVKENDIVLLDGEYIEDFTNYPDFKKDSKIILIDGLFSPVKKVSYSVVEDVRVGKKTEYERLILNIETDGSIQPKDAVLLSRKILLSYLDFEEISEYVEQIEIFKEEEKEKTRNKILDMSINELELSVRSMNHLREGKIQTVRELIELTPEKVKKFRQLGNTSLQDIIQALDKVGLQLNKD